MNGLSTDDRQKYLLTGATGFLGSHIMAELLKRHSRLVIFGRPSGSISLKARIRKLLNWFGIEHLEELLECYETDFMTDRLGLGKKEYDNLCSRRLAIIHCASDTSFAEKNREKVMRSNVESLAQILNFASKSKAAWFHYISTVFAAGIDSAECTEEPVNSVNFTNVYEQSKANAEKIIADSCAGHKVPFTIIRPSIVYGDSVTGRSLKFNALYIPVRSAQIIRDIYLEDIKKNDGKKASECMVHLDETGNLHLPMKIYLPDEGKINLIPVDYFTRTVFSIIEKPVHGTIYHITSNYPENMDRLTTFTQKLLNITGIKVVIGSPDPEESRNPPEELFDHFIRPYLPYISDKRFFTRENTDKATYDNHPTDLNFEIFQRCMEFAIRVDWGKKLFVS